jgi:hypothetical protein
MTLFIDLGCLYCKQTQRAFNVFKNTLNRLKIDSVDQKFNRLECGNFSQDPGTPAGSERFIAFSQLAVEGLANKHDGYLVCKMCEKNEFGSMCNCAISRHNKHSDSERTVKIERLGVGKFHILRF